MSKHFLPAEWYPQDAVMLTWPHQQMDWEPILSEVEPAFVDIASAVLAQQSLIIVAHNHTLKTHAQSLLASAIKESAHSVHWVITPTDDTWARDHGPITILNADENPTCLDFTFNAWGDKFASAQDDQINQALFSQLSITDQQRIAFILEGGGIESDGAGSLMTTKACLLNQNRNAQLTQQSIEATLKDTLGVQRILWLENGYLCGDDTDSHIDTLARFAPQNQILYVKCDDDQDEHFQALKAMEAELAAFTNNSGETYQLVPLPWPSPKYDAQGDRLPATYANFLIINQSVLVPTYQDDKDAEALAIFQSAFPNHKVVGIDCIKVIEQYGSLHCLTMQIPKGVLKHLTDNSTSQLP